jgi:hypothetical protein
MPRSRPSTHTIGAGLVLIVVAAIAVGVALSFAMNTAADDLRQQVKLASGQSLEHPRNPPATWLSAALTADLAASDFTALFARAEVLDHRADRIREMAGAASLLGLISLLLTARPEAAAEAPREASSPVASTRSNGTA